jgi:hypothetical protein
MNGLLYDNPLQLHLLITLTRMSILIDPMEAKLGKAESFNKVLKGFVPPVAARHSLPVSQYPAKENIAAGVSWRAALL